MLKQRGEVHQYGLHVVNATAASAAAASWLGWFPPLLAAVASFLSIVWFVLQIIEARTFRKFVAWIKSIVYGKQ